MIKILVSTLVLSQILILFISKFTALVSYAIILAYFLCSGMLAFKIKSTINGYESRNTEKMNEHDKEGFSQSIQYLYYGYYAVLGLMALSFTVLACFWKKIRLAIKCVKASGKYTFKNLATLLISLGNAVWYLIIIVLTGRYMIMKIQADGEQYFDNSLPFMSYRLNDSTISSLKLAFVLGAFGFFVFMKMGQYL